MITLKTGVPGSGKTLTAVAELLDATRGNWRLVDGKLVQLDPAAAERAVFTHGIPDLTVPTMPLPVYAPVERLKDGREVQIRDRWEVDWSVVPDGALVVIDEAQRLFPVRGASSAVPGYVSFLNVHRHRGIDIVLITQHPRLIDVAVRKLVGKHQHYRRLFGGQRHMRYEWDHCAENLQGTRDASAKVAGFPRRAYSAYKSAEVHTKQSFSIPWVVGLPVLALVGMVAVAPKIYDMVQGLREGRGITPADRVASAPGSAASGVHASAPVAGPRPADQLAIPGRAVAAALPAVPASYAYRDKWAASHWPVSIAGCWVDDKGCQCYTNGDRPRLVTDGGSMCVDVARGRLGVSPERPRPTPAVAPAGSWSGGGPDLAGQAARPAVRVEPAGAPA